MIQTRSSALHRDVPFRDTYISIATTHLAVSCGDVIEGWCCLLGPTGRSTTRRWSPFCESPTWGMLSFLGTSPGGIHTLVGVHSNARYRKHCRSADGPPDIASVSGNDGVLSLRRGVYVCIYVYICRSIYVCMYVYIKGASCATREFPLFLRSVSGLLSRESRK